MQYKTLVDAFQTVNGASFVGIDTLTTVKLTGGKKNPMQGHITKRMVGASVMVFQNKNANGYEAMVQRRLKAEGKDPQSFVLGERTWGVRVPNMPIVMHEKDGVTKYYVEVIFLKAGRCEYLLDGHPINPINIVGLEQGAVDADSQGGLENKVVVRCFAADSVTEVRIDGTVFK